MAESAYKTCPQCGQSGEFYSRQRVCKVCVRARSRAWEVNNPDRVRANKSKPEYRAKALARVKAWVAADPERARLMNAKKPSRAKMPEYLRAFAARNPEHYRMQRMEIRSRRRARMHENGWEPVDYEKVLATHGPICHICSEAIVVLKRRFHGDAEMLTFDHVIPIVRGGPHIYDNIRPAHARCNFSKHAKLIA